MHDRIIRIRSIQMLILAASAMDPRHRTLSGRARVPGGNSTSLLVFTGRSVACDLVVRTIRLFFFSFRCLPDSTIIHRLRSARALQTSSCFQFLRRELSIAQSRAEPKPPPKVIHGGVAGGSSATHALQRLR